MLLSGQVQEKITGKQGRQAMLLKISSQLCGSIFSSFLEKISSLLVFLSLVVASVDIFGAEKEWTEWMGSSWM